MADRHHSLWLWVLRSESFSTRLLLLKVAQVKFISIRIATERPCVYFLSFDFRFRLARRRQRVLRLIVFGGFVAESFSTIPMPLPRPLAFIKVCQKKKKKRESKLPKPKSKHTKLSCRKRKLLPFHIISSHHHCDDNAACFMCSHIFTIYYISCEEGRLLVYISC